MKIEKCPKCESEDFHPQKTCASDSLGIQTFYCESCNLALTIIEEMTNK